LDPADGPALRTPRTRYVRARREQVADVKRAASGGPPARRV